MRTPPPAFGLVQERSGRATMRKEHDYANRSASDRSVFGYVILLLVGIAVAAVVLLDLRSGDPAGIAPQQSGPGSAPPPQQPSAGPGVSPLP